MKKRYLLLTLASMLILITACSNQAAKKTIAKPKVITIKKKRKRPLSKVDRILKKMTLTEKIGQLYFIHSNGDFAENERLIKQNKIGGITLFAPDFAKRNHSQFLTEMKQYQQTSKHGLLIATDQEGGTVSRLNSNPQISKRSFLSPQEIYHQSGLTGIKRENTEVAQLLKDNGINMNFAPVADVAKEKSSFIYQRTLGENYQVTTNYIPVAVDAIQKQKVAATLKHFPGYGDAGDTHTGFAQINKPLANYEQEDLLPFKAGIKAGVDAIMVSHIVIKNLDATYPASLSTQAHQLLRKKLHYHGLIVTDDLQMGAITQFAQKHDINADLLALKAGNDLLLGGNPQTGIPAIQKAVKNKQISEKQINHSVKRILKLKAKLGILK